MENSTYELFHFLGELHSLIVWAERFLIIKNLSRLLEPIFSMVEYQIEECCQYLPMNSSSIFGARYTTEEAYISKQKYEALWVESLIKLVCDSNQ